MTDIDARIAAELRTRELEYAQRMIEAARKDLAKAQERFDKAIQRYKDLKFGEGR